MELPQLLVSSPGEVATEFSLVTATGGPQPRALYYWIRLDRRILMRPLRTLADAWLVRHPSFSSTESYSHALATGYIPFDLSHPPDSTETLVDHIRPLAVELSTFGEFPGWSSYIILPRDCHRRATASSLIPFDSSRPPDSNEIVADQIRPLAVELPQLLVTSPGGVAT